MPTERIIGLDGEMSGADLDHGHRLIQIGVAVDTHPDGTLFTRPPESTPPVTGPNGAPLLGGPPGPYPDVFCSLIGWPDDQLPWCERAAAVHRIPRDAVLAAPRAAEVDDRLYDWLLGHGADPANRRSLVTTGFNVGAFDAPFVRDALPRTATLLSRQYADLNPVCFLLGDSAGKILGGAPTTAAWKRRLKNEGRALVTAMGRTEGEHDAGTDAVLALGAWRAGTRIVADLDTAAARDRRADRDRRRTAHQLTAHQP